MRLNKSKFLKRAKAGAEREDRPALVVGRRGYEDPDSPIEDRRSKTKSVRIGSCRRRKEKRQQKQQEEDLHALKRRLPRGKERTNFIASGNSVRSYWHAPSSSS